MTGLFLGFLLGFIMQRGRFCDCQLVYPPAGR
ncbi:hypothetical protein SESI111939_21430 [Serratia silvae]